MPGAWRINSNVKTLEERANLLASGSFTNVSAKVDFEDPSLEEEVII